MSAGATSCFQRSLKHQNGENKESIRSTSENADLGDNVVSLVRLRRGVGFVGAVSLIASTMIGSGIFISPRGVFLNSGSVGTGLLVWAGCGVLSTCGALCYAELGTMIPKSDGDFTILLEAFGGIPAFLYAWTTCTITIPLSFAIFALTFARYSLAPAFGGCDDFPEMCIKLIAAVVILRVMFLNCASVKLSTRTVTFFGIGKVLSLSVIIGGGLVRLAQGHTESFQNAFSGEPVTFEKILMAFYQGLWAFEGWNQLNHIVEEVKNPFYILPRAIIVSILSVTFLNAFTNVAYLTAMNFDELVNSPAVGVIRRRSRHFSGVMSWIVPFSVSFSVLGTCISLGFSGGRIPYVVAREGFFPNILAMDHIKNMTPASSILMCGTFAIIALFPSDVYWLISFFTFFKWTTILGCCVSLLYFRYTMPDRERPIKVLVDFV